MAPGADPELPTESAAIALGLQGKGGSPPIQKGLGDSVPKVFLELHANKRGLPREP